MNRNRSSLFRYSSAATVFKILSSIFFQIAPAQSLLTFADMVLVCGSLVLNFRHQPPEWPNSPRQNQPETPALTGSKGAHLQGFCSYSKIKFSKSHSVAQDPEHSPSSQQVEKESLRLITLNPSRRSKKKTAKNSAAIQRQECTMAYCVKYNTGHSPSSQQVERDSFRFMTINPSSSSQDKSFKISAAVQRWECTMAYCV